MDPEANLAEQRSLAKEIIAITDRCTPDGQLRKEDRTAYEGAASRLAELVQALDAWILGGGFLPSAWRKPDVQLSEFFDDVIEYLDDRQDVTDGEGGEPRPNKAMQLLHAAEVLQTRYDPEGE